MVLALVVLVAVVGGAIGVRQVGRGVGGGGGSAIRRFFQYLLLYGLLVVVAIGLSGLLSRLFSVPEVVRLDDAQLARSLTFLLIGAPVYGGLAVWSRRRLAGDAAEVRSFGWAFYTTVASLTGLVAAMFAFYDVLSWAVGVEDYDGTAVAGLVVWSAVWAVHWVVDRRLTPPDRSLVHRLVGSLIGLGTSSGALVGLLGAALETLLGWGGEVIVSGEPELARAGVTLMVGAPVWLLYWRAETERGDRTPLWLVYVFLFGVAAGLGAALLAAGTMLFEVLVWVVGEPSSETASRHFAALPDLAAAMAVGTLVWWYHRSLLIDRPRTEVRRVYEYLMAGIGLVAAAIGVATVLVALLEAAAGTQDVVVEASAINTLLGAVTALAVGAPVWWVFWRRILAADEAEERSSPTRRVYLFLLFGVGGVAAVIALITAVFVLIEDVLEGTLGAETVRSTRFAVGILVATGAISSYHLAIFRADQEHVTGAPATPRYVLLIGAPDDEIASSVARRTGGRVEILSRTDEAASAWSGEEVMDLLEESGFDEVVVISGPDGPELIPVDRR